MGPHEGVLHGGAERTDPIDILLRELVELTSRDGADGGVPRFRG
jgi:hypothetical protein